MKLKKFFSCKLFSNVPTFKLSLITLSRFSRDVKSIKMANWHKQLSSKQKIHIGLADYSIPDESDLSEENHLKVIALVFKSYFDDGFVESWWIRRNQVQAKLNVL